jgi:Na+/H+ antiporter NhaD/arsenite permease-like protein
VENKKMVKVVLGAIGFLWGAFTLYTVLKGPSMPEDCDQYCVEPIRRAILGTLLFVVGMYLVIKGLMKYRKQP